MPEASVSSLPPAFVESVIELGPSPRIVDIARASYGAITHLPTATTSSYEHTLDWLQTSMTLVSYDDADTCYVDGPIRTSRDWSATTFPRTSVTAAAANAHRISRFFGLYGSVSQANPSTTVVSFRGEEGGDASVTGAGDDAYLSANDGVGEDEYAAEAVVDADDATALAREAALTARVAATGWGHETPPVETHIG